MAGRPSPVAGEAGSPSRAHPDPGPRVPDPGSRVPDPDRGASLIEALVAVGLIAGALVAVVQVAGQSVRALTAARDRSVCAILAVQKIEQLLSLPFRPPDSPSDALEADTPGYVEYLDARGRVAGQDEAHEGTVYARRWSIAPLARDARIVVIQVHAGRCRRDREPWSCIALANGSHLTAARGDAW